MQKQHASFAAVLESRRAEDVDELRQRFRQTENRIFAAGVGIIKELIAKQSVATTFVHRIGAVGHDHVIHSLMRRPSHLGCLTDEIEILIERPLPVFLPVCVGVLARGKLLKQTMPSTHITESLCQMSNARLAVRNRSVPVHARDGKVI